LRLRGLLLAPDGSDAVAVRARGSPKRRQSARCGPRGRGTRQPSCQRALMPCTSSSPARNRPPNAPPRARGHVCPSSPAHRGGERQRAGRGIRCAGADQRQSLVASRPARASAV
jgi:hypothetical protein